MDPVIKKAFRACQQGQSFALATITESSVKGTPRKTGAKMVVLSDGSISGTIGGGRYEQAAVKECLKSLRTGTPTTVTYNYFGGEGESICGGQIKVFIEPFAQQRQLIICGAGHISLPLSAIGKMLNFRVTIIDDRKELAHKKRFPHADRILLGPHAQKLAALTKEENLYIMITTQGHEQDYACLHTAVLADPAYLGVISSQRKKIIFLNRLRKEGVPENRLKRISIPSGLDIGAQTPEEIALSISAEIIKVYNKELLNSLKFKKKNTNKK